MQTKSPISAFWVSWEQHTRSRSICEQLGIPLYELTTERSRVVRYSILIWRTIRLYLNRPAEDTIIIQNPSIVLAALTTVFCWLARRHYIVDCHNAGVWPLEGRSSVLNFVAHRLIRLNPFTIVTNEGLARDVSGFGGRPLVLPDPLPSWEVDPELISPSPAIVFICTWAEDEPYREVISACEKIDPDCKVYITGKFQKALSADEIRSIPAGVELTGFLSEESFLRLLNSAWVIMDLTTRENCLLCGAYEATALEKPMILSDTAALREYFCKGAIYSDNSAEALAKAISTSLGRYNQLKLAVAELKQELIDSWAASKQQLIEKL